MLVLHCMNKPWHLFPQFLSKSYRYFLLDAILSQSKNQKKKLSTQEITRFFSRYPFILQIRPIFIHLFHRLSNVNHQELTPFRNRDKELRKKYYSSHWFSLWTKMGRYLLSSLSTLHNFFYKQREQEYEKIRNPPSSKSVAYAFRNRFEFQENERVRATLGLLPV